MKQKLLCMLFFILVNNNVVCAQTKEQFVQQQQIYRRFIEIETTRLVAQELIGKYSDVAGEYLDLLYKYQKELIELESISDYTFSSLGTSKNKEIDLRSDGLLIMINSVDAKLMSIGISKPLGANPYVFSGKLSLGSRYDVIFSSIYGALKLRSNALVILCNNYIKTKSYQKALILARDLKKASPNRVKFQLLEAFTLAKMNRKEEAKKIILSANKLLGDKDRKDLYFDSGYQFFYGIDNFAQMESDINSEKNEISKYVKSILSLF